MGVPEPPAEHPSCPWPEVSDWKSGTTTPRGFLAATGWHAKVNESGVRERSEDAAEYTPAASRSYFISA
jgi:hypothetical protein